MRTIPFVKAHARGNDFLVIDEVHAKGQHVALAQKLCSRNTGIGADGIEFFERRDDGTIFLRLINADGSEAELSGNGTRCVAAWLAQSEGLGHITFGTHGGDRVCKLIERKGDEWWIESAMGVPRVMPRTIEIEGVDGPIEGAMINVGNPHFVLFPQNEDFSSHGMTWQQLGSKIAVDPLFRFGTNVEFVRVLGPDTIEFRIFERGCGPTTSSGTGTCASSTAAISLKGVERSLTAIAQGGPQTVVWPDNAAQMMLTGPAEIICQGTVEF
ncbi:diaminopimelate epimerase [Granulicella cerasi]|uniref:Diaminopimelate epimerase n=1 Tax=Granulicella cerasi TaxID=741063 RepID=A0ABW1ZED4_9BACT|nr:diaminopimelate epimerase [Granulicella cerasi]